jgi:type 1 fimbria pilin
MFTIQRVKITPHVFIGICLLVISISSCQPATNTNANVNANTNTNANSNNALNNSNTSSETATSGVVINTREPEKYTSTLVFTLQTEGGDKTIGMPPLSVGVARSGDDRRVEFKLPDGTPLIYLDRNNHHYVIVPSRKQYAELTPEATGIQMHKMLTPGQLVESLKSVKGIQRTGDETFNGRPAEKYQYSKTANTNTKAGEVQADAYIYVDKETGLPLHAEIIAESSGDVKGVKAARVVAEMQNIQTNIDPSIFEVPSGYSQVPPEKIRQQIDALTGAVTAILRAMVANVSSGQPSASPMMSPSVTP